MHNYVIIPHKALFVPRFGGKILTTPLFHSPGGNFLVSANRNQGTKLNEDDEIEFCFTGDGKLYFVYCILYIYIATNIQ